MSGVVLPPSVNFHVQQACNMRCKFCFDTFPEVLEIEPKGRLVEERAVALVAMIAEAFDKVTFVGGEPTLCPWLPRLVRTAKVAGATTMLVTNGSRLSPEYLERFDGHLD